MHEVEVDVIQVKVEVVQVEVEMVQVGEVQVEEVTVEGVQVEVEEVREVPGITSLPTVLLGARSCSIYVQPPLPVAGHPAPLPL